ncbi:MAG: HAD-IA family hydrolase [Thiotrichaceae bacterium]
MSKLKALLFDVDGTLADTEADGHRVAFNKAFVEAGLDWNWTVEVYGQLLTVTGGKERIKYYINDFLDNFNPGQDLTEFAANLHQRKTHFYLEMLQQGEIPLRTGVERLLREVRDAGLRMGIATTTTPANVTYLLTSTLGKESLDWFEVIAAGDIVPAKKPAPDIFEYAMQKMGITAEETLAFEDSANGFLSSTGAGLKTLITVNGYTKDDNFKGASIVLDQMGDENDAFKVMGGDAQSHTFVNVAMLKDLFAQT